MLPVGNDYTLLDAALVECAYAGCDTIWIICNDDTAPLLRHRIGDYIEDPSFYFYNTTRNTDYRKRIPIFWGFLSTLEIETEEIVCRGVLSMAP
jgi:hypothetical protein